jgi:hypothetical protein
MLYPAELRGLCSEKWARRTRATPEMQQTREPARFAREHSLLPSICARTIAFLIARGQYRRPARHSCARP